MIIRIAKDIAFTKVILLLWSCFMKTWETPENVVAKQARDHSYYYGPVPVVTCDAP